MPIAATYVNESQLSVVGDLTGVLRIGVRLRLDQGTDGILITDVAAATFGGGNTTITTLSAALTANLVELQHGYTFVDDAAQESNFSRHLHRASWDGGGAAFGLLTEEDEVQALALALITDVASANKIIGYSAAGVFGERKALAAKAGHMTITPTPGFLTFALPQPVASTDSPTFAGLTLGDLVMPSLEGFLLSEGENGCSVIAPPEGGDRVLCRDHTHTAYEWRVLSLDALLDVEAASPSDGQVLTFAAGSGIWYPADPVEGGAGTGTEAFIYSLMHMQMSLTGGEF